ncbi:MAG TPA: antitoxin Xre/MbcA/ParS toxin-binding domain-containing protein [Cyclobacteriaceae bacterium]|jgi:putative toxin-antitoxin system antitoxin component (TIGR02293 family)|nr:antitoxin Xre/MbcA/ParS toxin-binding domain-containing protein [Cyclobacteriaceae bacterium]
MMDEVGKILKFVGIKRTNAVSLQTVAEQCLNKKAVIALLKNSKLPAKYILRYLGITARSLSTKIDTTKLSVPVSDRVLDLAQLYVHGIDAFDSVDKFNLWLETPIPVLEGRKPIDLIQSRRGMMAVDEIILRIEYGMFA